MQMCVKFEAFNTNIVGGIGINVAKIEKTWLSNKEYREIVQIISANMYMTYWHAFV